MKLRAVLGTAAVAAALCLGFAAPLAATAKNVAGRFGFLSCARASHGAGHFNLTGPTISRTSTSSL